MDNQGLVFAVLQYFTVEEKPRLYRRNTWFEDHLQMSDATAFRFLFVFISLAIALTIFMMVGGL